MNLLLLIWLWNILTQTDSYQAGAEGLLFTELSTPGNDIKIMAENEDWNIIRYPFDPGNTGI